MSNGWYVIGVMPQQRKIQRKWDQNETQGPTNKQYEEKSSTLIQVEAEETQYHK